MISAGDERRRSNEHHQRQDPDDRRAAGLETGHQDHLREGRRPGNGRGGKRWAANLLQNRRITEQFGLTGPPQLIQRLPCREQGRSWQLSHLWLWVGDTTPAAIQRCCALGTLPASICLQTHQNSQFQEVVFCLSSPFQTPGLYFLIGLFYQTPYFY